MFKCDNYRTPLDYIDFILQKSAKLNITDTVNILYHNYYNLNIYKLLKKILNLI